MSLSGIPCLLLICNPMDCSPPGSSVHGIPQERILERVAISFSWGSSQPKDRMPNSCVSCIGRGFLTTVPLGKPIEWKGQVKNSLCNIITVVFELFHCGI